MHQESLVIIIILLLAVIVGLFFHMKMQEKKPPTPADCSKCPASTKNTLLDTLWKAHVMWTREYMIAKLNSLKEAELIKGKLMSNHSEMVGVYAYKYGKAKVEKLSELLQTHIVVLDELLNDLGVKGQVDLSVIHMWQQNGVDVSNELCKLIGGNAQAGKDINAAFAQHLTYTMEEIGNYARANFGVSIQQYENALSQISNLVKYY